MVKYIAAIALIVGLSFYVSIQYKQHAQNPAAQPQKPANAVLTARTNKNAEGEIAQSEWNPPRWYRLFSWPDGIAVWGLFLTLIAIAEQTSETRRSAKAVEDSIPLQKAAANAALLNARALINAERSWVEVVPVPTGEGPGQWRFQATNHGRTPAEIVSTCCRFEIRLIDGLTEPPLYKDRVENYKRFIFPLDKEPVRVGVMPIRTLLSACAEEHDVLSGAKTFVIVGRVVYYDVLNRVEPPHETRYCYGWSASDDTLFSMGPSGYHGHT